MIANMPHEIAHTSHFQKRCEWKRGCSGDIIIYYRLTDRYIDEGIAELCQIKSIEPLLKKFPILYHDNLLKHYIFGHINPDERHTWGKLWMETIYEIIDSDFNKLFYIVSEPAISLDKLVISPEIQKEKVLDISRDTNPITFNRYKQRRGSPHTVIFPSCIIEFDGESFKVISHEQIRLE